MRRVTGWIAVAMLAMVVGVGVAAQAPPSFAGKWTLVPDANSPQGGGMGAGLGAEATIAQDAKTVTVTRSGPTGEIKSVYNLDGSDSKNTISFGDMSFDLISKVKWDGAKMNVTTTAEFDGNKFETSMSLLLDAAGALVVESTRPDFQGGGAPVTSKMIYKKG